MLADIHFIRPWFLLLLLPALAALWLMYQRRGRLAGIWATLVDDALQPFVLTDDSGSRHRQVGWWLAALCVVLTTVSLAGPAWQRSEVAATRSGDAMVVLLDLSRSMDATDVAPSRLTRVRLKLQDILRARAGGETALVVFSANAFVVTPLTEDVDTIASIVPTLGTDLMPSRGSYPESGIRKAMQLFEQSGVERGRILLITDGGNMPPAITATREARAAGHQMSVLAVGTPEGGPIPQKRGGFVTDGRGNIAIPTVNARALRRLAETGGGAFAMLSSDNQDIRTLNVTSEDTSRRLNAMQEQTVERWSDMGIWLLLPVVLATSLMFRRGGFAVSLMAVAALSAPRPVYALDWQGLWQTPDQRADAAMQAGDSQAAAELFDDPAWRATAQFRAGDFAASAAEFETLNDIESRYNLATALARQGQYDVAIETYEAVLEADPEHEDAQFNLDLLRDLQQQQSGQPGGQPGGDGEQGDPDESQQGQPGDQQQAGESAGDQSQSSNSEGQDGQQGERQAKAADEDQQQQDIEALQEAFRNAKANAEDDRGEQRAMTASEREQAEQQQALEQWLRRVPDDPGGLLRRKFRSQYQRRQLDQDGNRLWPDDRSEPW
ncbi:MAG: VWA domain-containing protein [Pseudomonadota bacterium]